MSARRRQRVDWSDLDDWDDSAVFDDWGTVEVTDDHATSPQSSPSAPVTSPVDASISPDDSIEDHDNNDWSSMDTTDSIVENNGTGDAVQATGDAVQANQDLGSWLDQSSMMDHTGTTGDDEDELVIEEDEDKANDDSQSSYSSIDNGPSNDAAIEQSHVDDLGSSSHDGNGIETDEEPVNEDSGSSVNIDRASNINGTATDDEDSLIEDSDDTNHSINQSHLDGHAFASPSTSQTAGMIDDHEDESWPSDYEPSDSRASASVSGDRSRNEHILDDDRPVDDRSSDPVRSSGHDSTVKSGTSLGYDSADTNASMMEFLGDDSDYEEMAKARQILRQKHGLSSMMRFRPSRKALDDLAAETAMGTRPVRPVPASTMPDGQDYATGDDSLGNKPLYDAMQSPAGSTFDGPSTTNDESLLDHNDDDGIGLPVEDYNESTIADAINHAGNDTGSSNATPDIDEMLAEVDVDDDDRLDLDSPSAGYDENDDDSLRFTDDTEDKSRNVDGYGSGGSSLSKSKRDDDGIPQAEVELDVDDSAPTDNDSDSDGKGHDEPKTGLKGLFKKFLAQAKTELHGGDEDQQEDSSQESGEPIEPSSEKRPEPSKDENRKKLNFKEIIGLLKSPMKLLSFVHSTIRAARKLSMIIGLVIILIIALAGANIPSIIDKGSASGQSVDEGTITVTRTAWIDSKAVITVKNKSDMIAHVSGKAVVRSWSPNSSPLTWIGARETASCPIPSTDVDPGATKEIKATGCSKPSGMWHRVKAELEYE